jgi:Fic family protein
MQSSYDPARPYNDLPPLPPNVDLETKAILKACVGARTAIAELRLAGQLIPDQSVLINTIPLLEAKDSSEIENIVTTNDALFREASQLDDEADAAAKEAVRYRAAIYAGVSSLKERPLTVRTAIDVCSHIKGVAFDIRKTPGTTLRNSFTGETVYTPPEGADRLRGMLTNWERFANADDDLDPLVRMAVLHYQFEAIHPFTDGNGRTGRVLNILALIQAGLLDIPTLYLSRHILRTRVEYYSRLQAVTARGEWEPWVLYMLNAVELTARWTNERIRAIRSLMDNTSDYVRLSTPGIYSHELIQTIFALPYTRIGHLIDRGVVKRVSASRYLKQLASIGVLEEEKVGRDKVFIHRKYMALLASDDHDFMPYPSAQA